MVDNGPSLRAQPEETRIICDPSIQGNKGINYFYPTNDEFKIHCFLRREMATSSCVCDCLTDSLLLWNE